MIELKSKLAKNIWSYCHEYPNEAVSRKVFEKYLAENNPPREIAEKTIYIEKEELFADSIDKTISFLEGLKKDGYKSIRERWSGYEDNYFEAVKLQIEDDDMFSQRIAGVINDLIKQENKRLESERIKNEKIKKLQAEIDKIKNS